MVTKDKLVINGFTLVELLIVIALIGVLTVIGFTSYENTQRVARDSRRVSDLKTIQNALEAYNSDNSGAYPDSEDCNPGAGYLPQGMLKDPDQTNTHSYVVNKCTDTEYCICADMENKNGNASEGNCTYGDGPFYCVSNLQ